MKEYRNKQAILTHGNGFKERIVTEVVIPTPKIIKVSELVKNKVVEVEFSDGEIQKCICQEGDHFDIETAISICLCKYLIGGTKEFNNTVRKGLKIYKDGVREKEKQEELKKRWERKKEKKIAQKARKAARLREEQIEIQKEAILRAMKQMERTV